ncbi:MAG: alpha/beta fold hydrolase [Actinomycetota bacterium]
MLLLHGLLATGDAFGASYDALAATRRVVVPDLLGFGRSLDEDRTDFGPDQHLDALDDALHHFHVTDDPVIVGAHSMGAAVALRWAARHPQLVERIVCWGPPLYPADSTVRAALADTGTLARLFATDTPLARRLCAWSCRHRQLAGWITALTTPALPSPIARSSPLHTWPAYRAAIDELVLATRWESLIHQLAEQGIGIRLVWGARDTIGDQALGRSLAAAHPLVEVETIAGAGHHLPLTHPGICIAQLTAASHVTRHDRA